MCYRVLRFFNSVWEVAHKMSVEPSENKSHFYVYFPTTEHLITASRKHFMYEV